VSHPWAAVPPPTTLLACNLCGAAVPMTNAQVVHLRWHQRLADLEARIAAAAPPRKEQADAPDPGPVPRLEGDMIIRNRHHQGPARA
jgi:hypothetical protein